MQFLNTVLKNMFFLMQLKNFKAFHKYHLNKTVFLRLALSIKISKTFGKLNLN